MMLPEGVRGFHELLDIVAPKRGGAVVILKAFFDASTRIKTGVFCVAGYAFTKLQVQKFDRDWWRLFGKYGGCHMKELVHREGRFRGIERAEADRLIKEAVAILRKRAWYGVAVSCNMNELHARVPRWIQGFEHAYGVCCDLAIATLAYEIEKSGEDHRVAYFFEAGDEYSGCAHRYMNDLYADPILKTHYRHYSHNFLGKDDALGLQAADLFAWEWAKFVDETLYQKVRPMRLSLANLMHKSGFDPTIYSVRHLYGDALKRYGEQVKQLGMQQIAEDNARKNRSSGDETAA